MKWLRDNSISKWKQVQTVSKIIIVLQETIEIALRGTIWKSMKNKDTQITSTTVHLRRSQLTTTADTNKNKD